MVVVGQGMGGKRFEFCWILYALGVVYERRDILGIMVLFILTVSEAIPLVLSGVCLWSRGG